MKIELGTCGRGVWKTLPVGLALLAMTSCASGGAKAPSSSPSPSASPSPGRLVDVGGYSLWIDCQGTGSPTLIMESGNNPSDHAADVWSLVEPELVQTTRVCLYDRAGNGWSEPRLDHRITVGAQASELDALLAGAGIEPPFVVVAHSFGGMVARAFTLEHPSEVTGMVLVDALYEGALRSKGNDDGGSVIDASGLDGRFFGNLPLAVVSSEDPSEWGTDLALHIQHQDKLAMLSQNTTHVVSTTSGHYVMRDEPALVLEAIREVVQAARSGTPLPRCDEAFPALGGICP